MTPQPFERLPTESAQAFEAFALYRDAGVSRSTRAVARQCGKCASLIQRWSRRHRWQQRIQAFEEHLAVITRQAEERKLASMAGRWAERVEESRQKDYEVAQALRTRAMEYLAKPPEKSPSCADLARMAEIASKLERLALGLPTESQALSGPDGQPLQVGGASILIYIPENGRDAKQ